MPFCTKCGHKLRDGNVFCGECGAPVPLVNLVEDDLEDEEEPSGEEGREESDSDFDDEIEPEEPQQTPKSAPRENQVEHCPACGEIVGLNDFVCGSCGHELRRSTDGSIGELYRKLEEIENSRPVDIRRKDKEAVDSAIEQRKANAIQNYPIPNTKEDLIEFLVMANANSCWDVEGAESKPVPAAWRSKLNQAYSKAELLFGQDERFQKIKAQSVDAERAGMLKKILSYAGLAIFFVVCFGTLLLMVFLPSCGIEPENTRLQSVLGQVYEYVDEGEYGLARKEAAELVYSKSTSNSDASEAADHWEEIRKETLEMIAQKERGE